MDDFDVEALLDASFAKQAERTSASPEIDKKKKSKKKKRSRSREREYSPKDQEYSPKDREYPPKDREYPPKDREYPPKDREYPPKDREYPPKDREYSPKDREYPPKDREYPPKDREYSPKDGEYSSKDREYHPKDREYHPKDREYPPKDREYLPKDREYPPKNREYPPKDREYPPKYSKEWHDSPQKVDRRASHGERSHSRERKDVYRGRERRSHDEYYPRDRRSSRGSYGPRGNPGRGSYGRDFHRRYDRENSYRDRRSRSRSRDRRNSTGKPRNHSPSPRKETKGNDSANEDKPARLHRNPDLSPEERDMRTVFCMQLSQRVRARDLEEFFSPVGKVQDVRIIMDNKTRRSKGIAYVEFQETYSVSLAMGYSGKKLLGVPIIVQLTQAEKNRAAASAMIIQRGNIGPMRLYVGSLHFNITEEMLKGIFEPFGKIDKIELLKDTETGRSKGYGFVTFHDSESAKKALDQLNGFELAGRPMKVGTVTDRTDLVQGPSYLDTEEMDRAGIDLGATGRLQLMAKLAEGTGFELPQAAVKALQLTSQAAASPMAGNPSVSIATQCFVLSNMFDPAKENAPNWDEDIKNDVVDECRNHGGALHVYVDKNSTEGNVYVKCPNLTVAAASVTALHGRYFAGRMIVAAYVPVVNYHMLFPDSANAVAVL